MIKCTLIEIDNDNRAIICVGEDPRGKVETTKPLTWIGYEQGHFRVGDKSYQFITADEAVKLG